MNLDQKLNLIYGGMNYQRFFNDLEETILAVFNQPIEKQPKYIAEMDCGDGSLLQKVYSIIKEQSERGKVLDQYPLLMIGADNNEQALQATKERLKGIPVLIIKGDISNPQLFESDLLNANVDVEQILHIRAFSDHGGYVSPDGEEINPHSAVQSLVEHLRNWARLRSKHGLIIWEVHYLPPAIVSRYLKESKDINFDDYNTFAGQQLVEAENFIIAAAEVGLFPKKSFIKKTPEYLPFTWITLNYFEQREYTMRFATEQDEPDLAEFKLPCFNFGESIFKQRVRDFPEGQLVLEKQGKVLGRMYSQRIEKIDSLHHSSVNDLSKLHNKQGAVLQFLTLDVAPEYREQHLGSQLLDFMLHRGLLMNGIETVVGIMRCPNYNQQPSSLSFIDYIKATTEAGFSIDPYLRFHQYHGAKVKGIIENYRPMVKDNHGFGVLIEYDVKNYFLKSEKLAPEPKGKHTKSIVRDFLQSKIDISNLDHQQTLKEIALNSLDFVELLVLLHENFDVNISTRDIGSLKLSDILRLDGGEQQDLSTNKSDEPLNKRLRNLIKQYPEIVPLSVNGERCCTFWIHPMSGDVGVYQTIAAKSDVSFGLIAIKARGFLSPENEPLTSVFAMAIYYAKIITAVEPKGPYHIVGFSFGGTIAYEIARQLQLQGKEVRTLLLVEAPFIKKEDGGLFKTTVRSNLIMNANFLLLSLLSIDRYFARKLHDGEINWDQYKISDQDVSSIPDEELADYLVVHCQQMGINQYADALKTKLLSMAEVHLANMKAIEQYETEPLPHPGQIDAWLFHTKSAAAISSKLWNPDYLETIQKQKGSLLPLLRPWRTVLPQLNEFILSGENHFDLLHNEDSAQEFLEQCNKIFTGAASGTKQSMHIECKDVAHKANYPIAIIGMSGQFPDAKNVQAFWSNLTNGRNSIREAPTNRGWDINNYYDPKPQMPDKTYAKHGGFLSDIDQFDPLFFNISPKEAESMDPAERLFLQEAWKAIEDAGYAGSSLSNKNWGVFVGVGTGDYQVLYKKAYNLDTYFQATNSLVPSRISYFLNLVGPAVSLDTACSSSLSSLAYACDSLYLGNCKAAIVGGVSIFSTPNMLVNSSQSLLLSPDGQCFTFDQRANGTVLGEAVGVVILKPLAQAVRDKDHIYGVIKGWGTNQDGKTNGISAPSVTSQIKLLRNTYTRFDINPSEITLVEAHGTGTKLGDPIEFQALTEAFKGFTEKMGYCALGSVKTNIGHTYAAAGVTGLIKVLLSIKNKQIPPSLNFATKNEYIQLERSPFFVNTKLQAWEVEPGSLRCAAVNSFGVTGINAHLVVEEYPDENTNMQLENINGPHEPYMIVLSAKTEENLKAYARELLEFLTRKQTFASPGAEINIAEIAYTLQVGRQAMEERLALIVESVEELAEKLKGFVKGKKAIENLYRGQVKRNKEVFAGFLADEDMNKTIDAWVTKGKYAKLLDLWVNGLTIDWHKFYEHTRPCRISLPTYPFAGERYWVPMTVSSPVTGTLGLAIAEAIHPLLHQNTSNLWEQRFSSIFTGNEFFLTDHVVKGQRVLPGVAYLEMARAAVEQATGALEGSKTGIRLKNVVWAWPIVVGGQPVRVDISLLPEENGEITYEIHSPVKTNNDEPVVHSQGIAVLRPTANVPNCDLDALKAQCNKSVMTSRQCYELFRTVRVDYGPAHRGIEQVYIGTGQVLAKLSLPDSVSDTLDKFVLSPSLMDSALQASVGLLIGAGSTSSDAGLKPFLPFALEELEIYDKCSSEMWALVRYSDGGVSGGMAQANAGVYKFDIDVCDSQGKICVRMKRFAARILEGEVGAVRGRETSAECRETPGTLLLEPSWQEQNVTGKDGYRETAFKFEHHLVILCEIGEDIGRFIQTNINGIARTTRCINLQSNEKGIAERFQDYAVLVFEEIKTILERKPRDNVLIQIVVPGHDQQQPFCGLAGLLKTAQLENPKLIGQLIERESGEDSDEILKKLHENCLIPSDKQVRYKNGRRLVLGWKEVDRVFEDKIPWRDQGCYLITGGTGGLGLIFAEEIVQRVRETRLVLVGRSELTEEKQARLKALEAQGAKVIYKQMDVAKRPDLDALIRHISEFFGELHGIIHSAGIIKDKFIINKNKDEFSAVLESKVAGLVNLDQASRELNLDFFIIFSSMASIVGNPGQVDYSTGNAFMDSYAMYRNSLVAVNERQGQTLSVNWPLWKDGGMHADNETEKIQIKKTGLVAMEKEVGIAALYQGLASGLPQIGVMVGNVAVMKQQLVSLKVPLYSSCSTAESTNSLITQESTVETAVGQDFLQEKTINYLKKHISFVCKVPVNRIEAKAALENYGIDSVMVLRLTNQLEETFGPLSKTLFFEYQDIQNLAEYFIENHRDQLIITLEIDKTGAQNTVSSNDTVNLIEPIKIDVRKRKLSRFVSSEMISIESREAAASNLDIAIIGLAGRYPGAGNIREFWDNLRKGKDCITEIPESRWDYRLYFDEDKNKVGKTYGKWGGFLDGVDQFDPLFFNISPKEAELMDPQERLFLQCVYETLEDAGYTREALGSCQGLGLEGNVGVYAGVMYEEYPYYGISEQMQGKPVIVGGSLSSIANRVSYFCNFHGPCMAVDTMCSSSLTAIHLACHSLQRGECELALAGGVNVSIHPYKYLALGYGKFLSSNGRCESFGEDGDGYVPGEGVGAVLLKPLSKAMADGDHIYGVIKGTAVNHGGKTNGYSVPNPSAQAEVIGRAFREAGVNPRTVSYLEAHGTGTSLGDPIEIAGLTNAFREYTRDDQFCAIGSIKSNIGHCEGAAGIAALTKVLLEIKNRQLVPSLHSKVLNPNIDFANTPFVVQQELAEWKRPFIRINGEDRQYPRIAGVSSFGAGGSNAHIIIEEFIAPERQGTQILVSTRNPAIIVLSAKSMEKLQEQVQQFLHAIREQQFSDADLAAIAYTLQVGREAMEQRLAVIVVSMQELEEKLQGFAEGRDDIADLYQGQVKGNKEALGIFTTDEDLQKAIDAWITKKKYSKILDLWVRGLTVDWHKLYGDFKPQRISLPTYPFAKERYWVPGPVSKPDGKLAAAQVVGTAQASAELSVETGDELIPVSTEKLILIKQWQQRNLIAKPDIQTGIVLVLGTVITQKLVEALFADIDGLKIIRVTHGGTNDNGKFSTDFYSASAGELLYQNIKERLQHQKLVGVIDITSYDNTYEQSVELECGKIVFLQKLMEHYRTEGYRLLQVTHQLQACQSAQTTLQGARLAGLYRMLAAEYRQIRSMTMDSDCQLRDYEKLAKQIQTEFLHVEQETLTECCYRMDERYAPQLKVSQNDDGLQNYLQISADYKKQDVILITGGSRGIGAAVAQHMAAQGVHNLVIIGREPLPEQSEWESILENNERPEVAGRLRHLQFLIDRGVRVHYSNISLTDQAKLSAMVQEIHQKFGSITGVFHCAGMTSKNPAFFRKALRDIEAVCEPKIKGLVTLHKALEQEPLEFFVLFSSISSIVPSLSVGQSDYAIANAYMDYYAQFQAGEGKTYFKSVQWPLWGETGMAFGKMQTPAAYTKKGLVSLSTQDGLALLDSIKKLVYPVSLPCVVIPKAFAQEQLLKTQVFEIEKAPDPAAGHLLVKEAAQQAEEMTVDLRTSIVKWIEKIIISELKLRVDQLDEDNTFDEYGVDSVTLAQLAQNMGEGIGEPVTPSLLLEYSSISALADYFMLNHAEAWKNTVGIVGRSGEVSPKGKDFYKASESSELAAFQIAAAQPNSPVTVELPAQQREEIAVVGLSCRFPGSPTKDAYWDLLTRGISAIKPVPKERWISKQNLADYGAWVDGIDLFDAKYFNINPEDAAIMDPQARIILTESLKAIYDAGYNEKQLWGQKAGVYIGGRSQPNMNADALFRAPNPILGIGQNYLAANVSRFFNLCGPSLVVDTACSSGITGLQLASDSLRAGHTDLALVGAVSILLNPFAHSLFSARNILSNHGEFHIFDKRSSGEVLGEGTGVVVLKRLKDAVKDGNKIYGIIKAIAMNNDGRTLGPGSPNIHAQKQVMQDALRLSGKRAEDIGYIEVNGGGSPVVDAVEIKALSEIYDLGNRGMDACFIGSVKPNIGHLLLTSGLAGFIRCVLSIYHKLIPPFLSALDPFVYYDFSESRICFNRETADWQVKPGEKRTAALNSFPDGGTNCHVIIEEFIPAGNYRQHYFSIPLPPLETQSFPLPVAPSSFMITNVSKGDKGSDMKKFKQIFKKIPDLKMEKQQQSIRNVWGEIR